MGTVASVETSQRVLAKVRARNVKGRAIVVRLERAWGIRRLIVPQVDVIDEKTKRRNIHNMTFAGGLVGDGGVGERH